MWVETFRASPLVPCCPAQSTTCCTAHSPHAPDAKCPLPMDRWVGTHPGFLQWYHAVQHSPHGPNVNWSLPMDTWGETPTQSSSNSTMLYHTVHTMLYRTAYMPQQQCAFCKGSHGLRHPKLCQLYHDIRTFYTMLYRTVHMPQMRSALWQWSLGDTPGACQ
jgi:hypothetical protein